MFVCLSFSSYYSYVRNAKMILIFPFIYQLLHRLYIHIYKMCTQSHASWFILWQIFTVYAWLRMRDEFILKKKTRNKRNIEMHANRQRFIKFQSLIISFSLVYLFEQILMPCSKCKQKGNFFLLHFVPCLLINHLDNIIDCRCIYIYNMQTAS